MLGERRALTHINSVKTCDGLKRLRLKIKCCSNSFFDVMLHFHDLLYQTHPSLLTKVCVRKATPPPVTTFNTKDVAKILKTILRITHHF